LTSSVHSARPSAAATRDLLRDLDHLTGPDDRETRLALGDLAAGIEVRRHEWLPE